ncbi:cryptochrome/photolyase family protein [Nocardiopsis metallicus]|uniref:Deoxyribodipyrimidine photolyase-related protein n=1 Tax=Nocardiopsis metallicus TaxID=179819 RepID=A0A840WC85_9ACTN|nr:cryptochrome/photolyase family protein [Nocardiopsis metallicus]MBB5489635.1 deoxyribodipyrimidine photolyase-related protein [Nocardiopsis metallicus]
MDRQRPLWLFGDQLGRHFHSAGGAPDRPILLIESELALRRRAYHRQKLHLVLAAMRGLADDLGDRVTLVRAATYREGLRRFGRRVDVHEPGSHAALALVERLRAEGMVGDVLPSPGFALGRSDFARWADARSGFRMEDFYRDQRRRFQILMEPDGEPTGGRWNFDKDNRQGPPRGAVTLGVPPPWHPRENGVDDQVRHDLDLLCQESGSKVVGRDGPRLFAVGQAEAQRALRRFLDERLPTFGTHQDAMLGADWSMSHSLLSVPLNLGLLDPLAVVEAAELRYRQGRAPLAATEGFVRQVLGWREWTWHLYWHLGPDYARGNRLRARAALPAWWRELDPGQIRAQCLRKAMGGVRDRGYAHHIERLMVLGSHALQRGFRPDELSEWFAASFVDGFPWVMATNVIGMSQYADGGIVATKPYTSGGAYINRMSDHCGSCAFDPKVRLGPRACPFTAGYWAWMKRNEAELADNHRMRQPLAGMRRLPDLDAVIEQERYRQG